MLALTLLLAGGALSLYCLYQLRRWMAEAESATADRPRRLEALVDELVATAETTVAVVAEKAEALSDVIARADDRLGRLEAALRGEAAAVEAEPCNLPAAAPVAPGTVPPAAQAPAVAQAPPAAKPAAPPGTAPPAAQAPAATPAPGPQVPPLHRAVYAEADAGMDAKSIARRLGVTKGEVELILGLRQPAGGGQRL